ncbi:MAG: type II toxin-antitoxin system YoeB family toxin [Pseudomonadota bacterium]
MRLLLTPGAAEDLEYWQSGDPDLAHKIEKIFRGLKHGAAVPSQQITALRLKFPQLMSVKITREHRIVFEQLGNDIIVHQCRYHY